MKTEEIFSKITIHPNGTWTCRCGKKIGRGCYRCYRCGWNRDLNVYDNLFKEARERVFAEEKNVSNKV